MLRISGVYISEVIDCAQRPKPGRSLGKREATVEVTILNHFAYRDASAEIVAALRREYISYSIAQGTAPWTPDGFAAAVLGETEATEQHPLPEAFECRVCGTVSTLGEVRLTTDAGIAELLCPTVTCAARGFKDFAAATLDSASGPSA